MSFDCFVNLIDLMITATKDLKHIIKTVRQHLVDIHQNGMAVQ